MKLHGYFRSTASWRVRIAIELKGLAVDAVAHHLRRGEQRDPTYLALNPQGLVPALALDDGGVLTQSLAIISYLDELYPEPGLFPQGSRRRAQVNAFAQVIACDIHPLQNLKVLARLRALGLSDDAVNDWARWVIEDGLSACAVLIVDEPGPFCFGSGPTLADICLVPQLANARRFGVEIRWPRLLEAEAACRDLPSFAASVPERQEDAE